MKKEHRFRYEMFVRIRDFWAAHRALFPESSAAAALFAQVAALITTIEEHLKNRVLGVAKGQSVKPLTRVAVRNALTTMTRAARRVTADEIMSTPFRLPKRRTLTTDLATARAFVTEARPREQAFVQFGLPPTFISDLEKLIEELQRAVDAQLASKTARSQAQAGLTNAVRTGMRVCVDLDLLVALATAEQPELQAAWQSARRLEGQRRRPSVAQETVADAPVGEAIAPPASGPAEAASSQAPTRVEPLAKPA